MFNFEIWQRKIAHSLRADELSCPLGAVCQVFNVDFMPVCGCFEGNRYRLSLPWCRLWVACQLHLLVIRVVANSEKVHESLILCGRCWFLRFQGFTWGCECFLCIWFFFWLRSLLLLIGLRLIF